LFAPQGAVVSMVGLFRWLKRANQAAKKRAEIILAAQGLLADMDPNWRPEAGKVEDDLALILMRLGLIHLQAVYQGQMAAQNLLRAGKARLN